MSTIFITEDMTYLFCVTLVKEGTRFYFMEEDNIKDWFEDAVWICNSDLNSKYVINGLFLKPSEIESLSEQNKIYELTI